MMNRSRFLAFRTEGQARLEPLFSLGTKMALLTTALLTVSFALCVTLTLGLARHEIRDNLEARISQHSDFLALASGAFVASNGQADRARLLRLCEQWLDEPAVI